MKEQLKEIFIHFHQHPELSFEEYETTAKIKEILTNWGISYQTHNLATGLTASFGPDASPHIMLRCDIDALPIQENAPLSYLSLNPGKMHACGHDYHLTSMLGTCYLLKQQEASLTHRITCLFQPGEEATQGAKKVIEAGALKGVDRIYGMHVSHDLPLGSISITPGANYAAPDVFSIQITGIGSHGAYPQKGRNPIVCGSHIVTGLANINANHVSTFRPSVISVTKFHGGSAWNVIPESVQLMGTIRTFDVNTRQQIIESMDNLVTYSAQAFGCTASLEITGGHPATNNHPELLISLEKIADELGIPHIPQEPIMAGEDFAYYQQLIPGCFFNFGMGAGEDLHHPAFVVDPDQLPISANLMAQLGIKG